MAHFGNPIQARVNNLTCPVTPTTNQGFDSFNKLPVRDLNLSPMLLTTGESRYDSDPFAIIKGLIKKYLSPLIEDIIIDTALLTICGGIVAIYILKISGLL